MRFGCFLFSFFFSFPPQQADNFYTPVRTEAIKCQSVRSRLTIFPSKSRVCVQDSQFFSAATPSSLPLATEKEDLFLNGTE